VFWSPGSKNISRKTLRFQHLLTKRARAQSGACAEVHFPDYGTVLWSPGSNKFQESTAISAPILPREPELTLEHVQRCSFLILEQSCGPLTVELVPGSSAISAHILQVERELRLERAQRCSFLIMEENCGPLAEEMIPGNHCDFSTFLAKRARAQSGACAEVQFPD
jgi:hypothetical protein